MVITLSQIAASPAASGRAPLSPIFPFSRTREKVADRPDEGVSPRHGSGIYQGINRRIRDFSQKKSPTQTYQRLSPHLGKESREFGTQLPQLVSGRFPSFSPVKNRRTTLRTHFSRLIFPKSHGLAHNGKRITKRALKKQTSGRMVYSRK